MASFAPPVWTSTRSGVRRHSGLKSRNCAPSARTPEHSSAALKLRTSPFADSKR